MRDERLLGYAKRMRREMTDAEKKLWLTLRALRFENAKFRRQVVIGPYIADFACRIPRMLVVEVDGDTHAERFLVRRRTNPVSGVPGIQGRSVHQR